MACSLYYSILVSHMNLTRTLLSTLAVTSILSLAVYSGHTRANINNANPATAIVSPTWIELTCRFDNDSRQFPVRIDLTQLLMWVNGYTYEIDPDTLQDRYWATRPADQPYFRLYIGQQLIAFKLNKSQGLCAVVRSTR